MLKNKLHAETSVIYRLPNTTTIYFVLTDEAYADLKNILGQNLVILSEMGNYYTGYYRNEKNDILNHMDKLHADYVVIG